MSLPGSPESAGIFLLASGAKTAVLFCAAWVITAALRKRSAALRHQVWVAAILASLVLPVLAPLLPAWHSKSLGFAVSRLSRGGAPTAERGRAPSVIVHAVSARSIPATWPEVAWAVWAVGFGLLLVRLAVGFARMATVRARSTLLRDGDWMREVVRISGMLGISRPVRLLQAADPAAMPLAWGLFQPHILVPSSAAEWPEDRRRIVLFHELTHIARHDCGVQILAEFIRAVYWFDPLAWLAVARLRRESECASDDSVLNSGVEAPDYADHLLALARSLDHRNGRWLPALAMARSAHLERRFMAMLNSTTDRRASSAKFKLLTALAAMCLLIPLAAVRLPAQNESGKFNGTIRDPSGAAIPNATIIMIGKPGDTRDMTVSDAAGNFQFTKLPAGQYDMQVLKPGFKAYTAPALSLEPGRDDSQNVTLEIGAVEEGVEAEGPQPANSDGTRASVTKETPKRIRIGGEVEAAHLFTEVMPVYPQEAKAAGVEGSVLLHAIIGKDGTPLSLRVMNGNIDPQLARASVEAVSHWRYRPTLLNGDPIEVATTIEVNFTLKKE
jgi:TonB family protein